MIADRHTNYKFSLYELQRMELLYQMSYGFVRAWLLANPGSSVRQAIRAFCVDFKCETLSGSERETMRRRYYRTLKILTVEAR